MHRSLLTLSGVTAILASADLASAQLASTGGPTRSLAAGISLGDTPVNTPELLRMKPPQGSGTAAPYTGGPPNGVPDYSLAAMFPTYASVIRIDAHDSGNGFIPVTSPTSPDPNAPDLGAAESWLEIVISVDNDAVGLQNSFIARRALVTNGRTTPGADIIGYVMDGSVGIDPDIVGRTVMEQVAERSGLGGDEDIDAFDFGMGAIHFGQVPNPAVFFTNDEEFYFSLDPSCIDDVISASPSGFFTPGELPNTATIYRITWNGSTWSDPEPYVWDTELDLDGSPTGADNVDALAVDPVRNTVVYSTQIKTGHSQLKFMALDATSPVGSRVTHLSDLGDGSGGLATTRLGSNDETDEVDGVCIVDPETDMFGTFLGTPLAQAVPGHELGLSTTLWVPDDKKEHDVSLLASSVLTEKDDTTGLYFLQAGPSAALSVSGYGPTWYWIGAATFDDASQGLGTKQALLSYPHAALAGAGPVAFQCVVVDSLGAVVETSWVSVLRL